MPSAHDVYHELEDRVLVGESEHVAPAHHVFLFLKKILEH
jgi:hypothetical protein